MNILDTLPDGNFDIIIVGSGFAGTFFLEKALELVPDKRILVVERGSYSSHWNRVKEKTTTFEKSHEYYINQNPELKDWGFTLGFGGGSQCWTGNTPRIFPDDFKVNSLFGFGSDWPIEYDDLEPYYSEVEQIMEIAGSTTPYFKSKEYPLNAHRLSPVDKILQDQHPNDFFALPSARATSGGKRASCCSNGVCSLCPVDAKFTIENGAKEGYSHDHVFILFDTEVKSLNIERNQIKGIQVNKNGKDGEIKADYIVLGANGIFNPYLLLKSGIDDGIVGRGITEQQGLIIDIQLSEINNYQGGSIGTGWYTKGMKRDSLLKDAAFMVHTENLANSFPFGLDNPLRNLRLIATIEDFRQQENQVFLIPKQNKPGVTFRSTSIHTKNTESKIKVHVENLLKGISFEKMEISRRKTEWHIQCSTPMGDDPNNSVVDKYGQHHKFPNLILLGSGNFPTAPPSNPTLTICALSRYSANHIFKK